MVIDTSKIMSTFALSGKKTYLVAAAGVAYGVYQIGFLNDQESGVKTILAALGLAGLRAGVTKSGPETILPEIQTLAKECLTTPPPGTGGPSGRQG